MPTQLLQLAIDVRTRRGERDIRAAAQQIGISPATMCRIERGRPPDFDTFAKLCKWLEADPAIYLGLRSTVRPAHVYPVGTRVENRKWVDDTWYHSNPELHMFRRRHAIWTWFYVTAMLGMGVFQAWCCEWLWVAFHAVSVWYGVLGIRDDMRTWPRFTE